jgi:hypothetical protein
MGHKYNFFTGKTGPTVDKEACDLSCDLGSFLAMSLLCCVVKLRSRQMQIRTDFGHNSHTITEYEIRPFQRTEWS